MRDRLVTLQAIREEEEDNDQDRHKPECDEDNVGFSHEAVVFQGPSVVDQILVEAHSMRKEISLLHLEVERLHRINERFGTSVRRLTLLKQDSNSIARKIHQRGEALYARIKALGMQSRHLEEQEGPSSAASRIARTQHQTLTLTFHSVMADYNKAEEIQRDTCRERIQRQASILGNDISDEQLDTIVDKGGEGWAELSTSVQTDDGRTSRWALCEIKHRHKELVELEARMREVHDLFQNMAMLVEEQGSTLNSIEANVCGTLDYTEKINEELKKAVQYKRRDPCQTCCPWLSCWRRE